MAPKEAKTKHRSSHKAKTHHKSTHKIIKTSLTEEPQTKEQQMDEGLQAIFGDQEMDMGTFDRGKTSSTRILGIVVFVLFVLSAVSWAGYFAYSQLFSDKNSDMFHIAIDMEEELASGEVTEIRIQYKNPTTVPIASLELDVNIPDGFQILELSKEPTNSEDLRWDLGSLPGLTDEMISIRGIWMAQVPSQMPVQVYATYKPGNFNSEFEAIDVVHITTLESTLDATISGTEEASAGEDSEYTLTVKNTGQEAFESVLISLSLPEGFYLLLSDPQIESGGPAQWVLKRIEPQEEIELRFTGTFASNVSGFQYIKADVALDTPTRKLIQNEVQSYTDVLVNDVSIQLVANGSAAVTYTGLGESLRISLGLENTQSKPIESVAVLLDFQSEDSIPIAWSRATLDGGTITRDGIVWNVPSIEPGEKILLTGIFPMDTELGVGDAHTFKLVASARYEGRTVLSSPLDIFLNANSDIEAQARYYDDSGSVLGNGPLPPKVGQTTTYRILWTITSALHDLKNVRVSATLPPDILWQGSTEHSHGAIHFDSKTNEVVWGIDSLSIQDGSANGSFSLGVTPDAQDVGLFLKLLSATELRAIDAQTNQDLTDSAPSLSTDLEQDTYAAFEGGTVVE